VKLLGVLLVQLFEQTELARVEARALGVERDEDRVAHVPQQQQSLLVVESLIAI